MGGGAFWKSGYVSCDAKMTNECMKYINRATFEWLSRVALFTLGKKGTELHHHRGLVVKTGMVVRVGIQTLGHQNGVGG